MKRRIMGLLLASLVSAGALAAEPALVPVSQEALLERQQKGDESTYVLDVRSPEEYASGHVPGAVNIPYDQIASRMKCSPARVTPGCSTSRETSSPGWTRVARSRRRWIRRPVSQP